MAQLKSLAELRPGPNTIRCAECHELVPAERVQHREERAKVARRPLGAPRLPLTPPPSQPPFSGRVPARPFVPSQHSHEIDRIPVCVDCLRRQRTGLLGVCGVVAACLIAGALVYSQDQPRATSPMALAEPPLAHAALASAAKPAASVTAPPAVTPPAVAASLPPRASTPAGAPSTAAPAPAAPVISVAAAPPATPAGDSAAAAPSDPPPVWTGDVAMAAPDELTTPPRPLLRPRKAPARKPVRHPEAGGSALAMRQDGYDDLRRRDYPAAFALLQAATAMGDAYAPLYLGQAFENGLGVARNVGQATYWYGVAIGRGNAAALSAFNRLRQDPY